MIIVAATRAPVDPRPRRWSVIGVCTRRALSWRQSFSVDGHVELAADRTHSCAADRTDSLDGHAADANSLESRFTALQLPVGLPRRVPGVTLSAGIELPLPRQAAFRLGGPVLWMVPSGNRMVSSRFGPSSSCQSASWTFE